jgi:Pin2-interacting protein X1
MPIKINYGGKNSNSNNNITNDDEKNNVINFDELMKYKKNLEKKQMEFCDIFDETNLKKKLFETQLMKLNENAENEEIKEKNDKKENKDKKDKIEKKEKNEEKKVKKFIGKKIKRTSKKKK